VKLKILFVPETIKKQPPTIDPARLIIEKGGRQNTTPFPSENLNNSTSRLIIEDGAAKHRPILGFL